MGNGGSFAREFFDRGFQILGQQVTKNLRRRHPTINSPLDIFIICIIIIIDNDNNRFGNGKEEAWKN